MPEPKARDVWHEVQPDEGLPNICVDYGIKDWKKVRDHPQNAALKRKRPDPWVLYKGDKVWIPDLEPHAFEVDADGQEHTFVLHPPTLPLDLEVGANVRYRITCDGARFGGDLRTGSSGRIVQDVPLSRRIEIEAWVDAKDEPVTIELLPGHLDPIDTPEGIVDRLRNLGYDCGEDPEGTIGEDTRQAIEEFQDDHDLPATGELDERTRRALQEAHGA